MPAATEMGKFHNAFQLFLTKITYILGEAFYSFHSTVAACLMTTSILVVSYIFSARTYGLMRQSIFVSQNLLQQIN